MLKSHRTLAFAATACGLAIAFAPILQAQKINRTTISSTSAASGQEMYQEYCASCHGQDGKGKGPASAALKIPATNLTTMSAQHGGEFPSLYIMNTLGLQRGSTPAHGTSDMPVWGDVFRVSGAQDQMTFLRLHNLTSYLESIQDPPPQAKTKVARAPRPMRVTDVHPSSGSAMFVSYCASCHGADGRGRGPATPTLKGSVPDLTQLTKANSGKFPGERVTYVLGWIRGTEAHGSKEMPMWGDLFRTGREDDATVKMRIQNIVTYLESIQDH